MQIIQPSAYCDTAHASGFRLTGRPHGQSPGAESDWYLRCCDALRCFSEITRVLGPVVWPHSLYRQGTFAGATALTGMMQMQTRSLLFIVIRNGREAGAVADVTFVRFEWLSCSTASPLLQRQPCTCYIEHN